MEFASKSRTRIPLFVVVSYLRFLVRPLNGSKIFRAVLHIEWMYYNPYIRLREIMIFCREEVNRKKLRLKMAITFGILSLAIFSLGFVKATHSMAYSGSADVVQSGDYSGQYGDQLTPDSGIAAAHSHTLATVHSAATAITTTTASDQQEGDYSGQYGDQLAPDTGTGGEAPETTTG
ncbi:MAG: hypothetical protein OK457_03160 [Thaumarchaeota archaeon]|nr:hypothetical protein [Nitrososphaerota archaeon]